MKSKKLLLLITMFICFLTLNHMFGQGDNDWSNVISENYKIVANDGAIDDEFGYSIAIDNGIIAVGMPYDDDNGSDSGAAYLFDASTGNQIFKLLPSDGTANAEFGYSIAINNGIVAIGARRDSENGTNSGAAYLFDANTGNQIFKLQPNDAEQDDEFGNAIDISNGIVAVGAWRADEFGDASGAAYLFDASTGNQIDKLLPDTGNDIQTFGVSIAIDGGTVAVGSRTYFALSEGYTYAKAYLFNVSSGNLLNILQPDILNLNGDLGGHFADCMAIDNGLVIVGAPTRSVVFDHSGAAYVFDVTSGNQLNYIVPNDAHDRDNFGISVSIDNGIAIIGAHQDDINGFNSGSMYIYNAVSGSEINKLDASDGDILDIYGNAVAIEGNFAVVAAKDDDDNGSSSGSAYVYSSTTLDITENKLNTWSIYPNPSSGNLTVDFGMNLPNNPKIRIYNNVGRLIEVIDITSSRMVSKYLIDVSNYRSGIYYVQILFDEKSEVKKLLVK